MSESERPPHKKVELFLTSYEDPEEESDTYNFMIRDPKLSPDTDNAYCMGYRFLGGDKTNPDNWEYDHTNYWDWTRGQEEERVLIERDDLEKLLSEHGTSLSELLAQYCQGFVQKDEE